MTHQIQIHIRDLLEIENDEPVPRWDVIRMVNSVREFAELHVVYPPELQGAESLLSGHGIAFDSLEPGRLTLGCLRIDPQDPWAHEKAVQEARRLCGLEPEPVVPRLVVMVGMNPERSRVARQIPGALVDVREVLGELGAAEGSNLARHFLHAVVFGLLRSGNQVVLDGQNLQRQQRTCWLTSEFRRAIVEVELSPEFANPRDPVSREEMLGSSYAADPADCDEYIRYEAGEIVERWRAE